MYFLDIFTILCLKNTHEQDNIPSHELNCKILLAFSFQCRLLIEKEIKKYMLTCSPSLNTYILGTLYILHILYAIHFIYSVLYIFQSSLFYLFFVAVSLCFVFTGLFGDFREAALREVGWTSHGVFYSCFAPTLFVGLAGFQGTDIAAKLS